PGPQRGTGEGLEGEDHSGTGSMSAAQLRAEKRRRKLLLNSEDRMNRIVGFAKNEPDHSGRQAQKTWRLPSPFLSEAPGVRSHTATPERRGSPLPDFGQPRRASLEGDVGGLRHRAKAERPSDEAGGSPRRGLHQYLSRFDDAMKLRSQLANEKPEQDGGSDVEEFDPFRVFRLVGSVLLAVFVRVFVCKYLSIFAPFLTLELAYMGLSKYFPKVEKKTKTTVLTAALLLSGIPAEVISRSMDTYRRMGDVFSDLCVYFFTFIISHEILTLFGSETP
uniref:Calcium signal-modulating cyclophilin ligand n=1 Tax=Poecilia mexicana TaxID=48701 RepID=A0A3B3XHM9_9TELE